MYCTTCGQEVPEDMKFCVGCGAPVSPEEPADPSGPAEEASVEPQPKRRMSKRAKIIGIGAGVAALAVVAVGVLFAVQHVDGTAIVEDVQSDEQQPDKDAPFVIDERTVPSESLRKALLEQVDLDGDGIVSPDEASQVTGISLHGEEVAFHQDEDLPQISIAAGSADAASNGGNTASSGGSESSDPESTEPESSDPMALPDFDWSGVTVLDCRDEGLAELDLSKMPNLEYVDCRGNDFSTLDLTNNKAIKTLYCDDDVELSGLDKAGLYFTDLLTSATYTYTAKDAKTTPSTTYEMAYDADARPTSVTREGDDGSPWATYVYDDKGNLVEKVDAYRGVWTYAYDESGEHLTSVKRNGEAAASFTYDDEGRLIGMLDNAADSLVSYVYDDGTIVEKGETYEVSYAFNDRRLLEKEVWKNGTHNYGYNVEGQCTAVDIPNSITFSASLNAQGFPQEARFVEPVSSGAERSAAYQCNRDGYIASGKMSYENGGSSRTDVTYVKRVGSLVDRPRLINVPSFSVCTRLSAPGTTLFSSGGWALAEVGEALPVWKMMHAQGLEVALLQSPNEAALDAYDREQSGIVPKGDNTASATATVSSGSDNTEPVSETNEKELSRFMGAPCSDMLVSLGSDPAPARKEVASFSFTEGPLVVTSYEKKQMAIPVVDKIELTDESEYRLQGLSVGMKSSEADDVLQAAGWTFLKKSDFSSRVWYEKSGVPYRVWYGYRNDDDDAPLTYLALDSGN